MIACEKKRELKVIPLYKIVVVRTYILKFLTHWPPSSGFKRFRERPVGFVENVDWFWCIMWLIWQEAGGNCVRTGLINTHVHTSQQLARGIADDVDLLTWLHGRIWPYEATMTEDDSYLSTLLCGIELIHSGVCKSPFSIDSSPEALVFEIFWTLLSEFCLHIFKWVSQCEPVRCSH